LKQIGLVAIAADAVVSKDVAEGALLAASPPGLTPGSSTRVKKLPAQTQSLPWAYLINSREGGFDPAIEPQLVQLRVSHFYGNTPTSTAARSAFAQPNFNNK